MNTCSHCRSTPMFRSFLSRSMVTICMMVVILTVTSTTRAQLSDTRSAFWFQEDAGLISEHLDGAGSALAIGDFNADGREDLVIGIPDEDVGTLEGAGVVAVSYGAPGGWDQRTSQWWWQGTAGVAGLGEAGDSFGFSLAVGDFDCDGFDDLAVGSPFEDANSTGGDILDIGAVVILYGSPEGLVARGSQIWAQNTTGIEGEAETGERFGLSVAAGDFDGDSCDDLAIGVPGDFQSGGTNGGAVQVLYGSAAGLSADGNQLWNQDIAGVAGIAEDGDSLGFSLVAGDFDGDYLDDLAIGAPFEDFSTTGNGFVGVLYGSLTGLVGVSTDLDYPTGGGRWGWALAAGDFNGDGRDDLIGGAPRADEIDGTTTDFGYAKLFFGTTYFPLNDAILHHGQNRFGQQVTAGDFDGNGFDETVVMELTSQSNGVVWVGAVPFYNLFDASDFDYFGDAFAVGDLNGDRVDDLAIGIPNEEIGGVSNAGMVQILFGHGPGIFFDGFESGDTLSWQ